jgi:hypothetical protein
MQCFDRWEEVRLAAKNKVTGTRGLADGHKAHLLDVANIVKQSWDKFDQSVVINAWLEADCLPECHIRKLKAMLSGSSPASSEAQLPAALSEQDNRRSRSCSIYCNTCRNR